MALIACVAGSLGHLVMKALKRDRGITNWGTRRQVGHRRQRPAGPGRRPVFCRAGVFPLGSVVFWPLAHVHGRSSYKSRACESSASTPACRPPASAWSTWTATRCTYVASGTIKTTHLDRGNLPARLKVLFDGICEVTARYQPDSSACEIVFVNVNPQATLLLGQARGACVTALVSCNI